jgi:hypothetical protein
VPRLLRLGRWANEVSLHSYVQVQAAMLGATGWSPEATGRIARYARRLDSKLLDFE